MCSCWPCSVIQAFLLPGTVLLDWRLVVAIVVAAIVLGPIVGIVSLYFSACLLKWSGYLFGGRASTETIRTALAWGPLPSVVAIFVSFIVFIGLASSGLIGRSASVTALNVLFPLLGLWSLIYVALMYARVQAFGFWRAAGSIVVGYFILTIPIAAMIALSIRTFVFQPFNIPSGSMMPTLLVGDDFFVAKYSYGYSHYSLPFSPRLFSGRILASEPQRGDVVVFRLPKDDSVDYVKRIVGLPGDRIQMINGVLQINGQAVKHEQIEDFVANNGAGVVRVKRYRETLPNGVSYTTLDLTSNGFYDNTPVYAVPPGHYFVIGDNTDNSTDSRVLSQVGYVPFENLIGRVAFIYFSVDRDTDHISIRFERIGSLVH